MEGIVMNIEWIKGGYLLTWNHYKGKGVEKQFFQKAFDLRARIAEIIDNELKIS